MASELDLLIATRRDLHRHPELGFEERRTAGIVADRLRRAGWEVQEGVAETGVVGTLRGEAGDGPTLLLRADMDALPIQEEANHDFASTIPGRMHACGHDAHVAIGLAVAERLALRRRDWRGTVKYVFQPAATTAWGERAPKAPAASPVPATSWNSVGVRPGESASSRTPTGRFSEAAASVNERTNALLAA